MSDAMVESSTAAAGGYGAPAVPPSSLSSSLLSTKVFSEGRGEGGGSSDKGGIITWIADSVAIKGGTSSSSSPWAFFCLGAFSASVVWWSCIGIGMSVYRRYQHQRQRLLERKDDFEEKGKKAGKEDFESESETDGRSDGRPDGRQQHVSFPRRSLSALSSSISQHINDHIGELPKNISSQTIGRWPWDRIKRSVLHYGFDAHNDNDNDNEDESVDGAENDDDEEEKKDVESEEKKSGLCIGSIFGLDVGGTLAKLVYFEQESREFGLHQQRGDRIEHYHQALSAQVVLRARRCGSVDMTQTDHRDYAPADSNDGTGNDEHDGGESNKLTRQHSSLSEQDLQRLYQLRQKSVPDNLANFANEAHITSYAISNKHQLEQDLNWMAGSPEPLPGPNKQSRQQTSLPQTPPSLSASALRCCSTPDSKQHQTASSSPEAMKRSHSMFDILHTAEHAEALSRFYNFARRLDTYETGVKDKHLSFYSRYLGGEFHFMRFETRHMMSAMDLIRVNDLHLNIREMGATGGGAHKYAEDWKRLLGITIQREEELDSLVAGMQFVMEDVPGECYTFKPSSDHNITKSVKDTQPQAKIDIPNDDHSNADQPSDDAHSTANTADQKNSSTPPSPKNSRDEWTRSQKVQRDVITDDCKHDSGLYPYLLVTIGTGVSILRVDGPREHERVSGSTIGGGTYWGICRLLTTAKDFEEVLNLAERGDPSKVDMMVGDIYGQNSDALEKLGLPANVVASSFGKLVAKANPASGLREEDLAHAILLMVTNNIGQVAYLNATLHNTNRIFFVGNFLRHNLISQRRLASAIHYWSKGKMEALFLEHEGYFGALGAFLLSQGITHDSTATNTSAPTIRERRESQEKCDYEKENQNDENDEASLKRRSMTT